MTDEYYNLKWTCDTEAQGIVVKIRDGKLKTVAGDSPPSQFGCYLNTEGRVVLDRDFTATPIDSATAEEAITDYKRFIAEEEPRLKRLVESLG